MAISEKDLGLAPILMFFGAIVVLVIGAIVLFTSIITWTKSPDLFSGWNLLFNIFILLGLLTFFNSLTSEDNSAKIIALAFISIGITASFIHSFVVIGAGSMSPEWTAMSLLGVLSVLSLILSSIITWKRERMISAINKILSINNP